ncbi:MAG: hypothetical protein PHP92_01445 [Candidatus Nanoarchaeia archaeon]|nr:hypothetical protein [Candidatus Nanoarchaeia archaeon]
MRNKFFRDQKGLSTIVVTLIIILLSLVSIGIVWVVVNNLVKGGTSGVEIGSKCLEVDVAATKTNCSAVATEMYCAVTLSRTGTGSDAIGGVKLVFKNETSGVSGASIVDVPGDIPQLVTQTTASLDTGLTTTQGVNKVEVTVYFDDADGNEQLCPRTSPYSF